MSSLPVYTSLNFPTATSRPSLTCLQWSAEGQLCFATKNAAYILTPNYGISYDNTSAIQTSVDKANASDLAPTSWFRTIVQFDSGEPYRWPESSQDWGAVSLGSLDSNLWAVAISPSNLSTTSGCIIATLSSNSDLRLWAATRNPLKGEWDKVFDATPYLLERFREIPSDHSQTAQTLRAQVVSICWTPQVDFGIAPVPRCNGSLLIAGNRAGSILFLRFTHDSLELVNDVVVSDCWITNIAFTTNPPVESGKCSGILAYGTSAGAVGLLEVTQALVEKTDSPSFYPEYVIEIKVHDRRFIFQPDKAGITSMRWISPSHGTPVLVFCKPGKLLFWSPSKNPGTPCLKTLPLLSSRIHKSSSPFHPVTGLIHIPHKDILIATLADGSFHAIHNLSSNPSWSEIGITSRLLSNVARSVSAAAQEDAMDNMDMNRITGATSFDNGSTIVWAQEIMRPSDFSYKHDAKHNSTLIVAQLWEHEAKPNDLFLKNLTTLLDSVKASWDRGPLDLLRPYLFQLYDQSRLDDLHSRILQILPLLDEDHSLAIAIPPCTAPLSHEVRRRFRESLSQHLFGYDALLSLRMRLLLADLTWKLSYTDDQRHACGHVAQPLLNAISHRSLRTILRHLSAVVDLLQPEDIPFIIRMRVQSQLPGSPADLFTEAQTLLQMAQARGTAEVSTLGDLSGEVEEKCPACGLAVPFKDIITGVCTNGHTWTRCSITTFILTTPYVRTCIGCSRKAFLPFSMRTSSDQANWLPPSAQGWVVEELLAAIPRCLFCNNSFVRIL